MLFASQRSYLATLKHPVSERHYYCVEDFEDFEVCELVAAKDFHGTNDNPHSLKTH